MSEHDGRNLVRSLKSYGVIENIVVNRRTDRIVSGHMRVASAIEAGIATVPVHYIDVDETTERQINLTMNRTRGEWDEQGVAELLAWLSTQDADLSLTGFQDAEIARIMDGVCDVGLDPPEAAGAETVPERWMVIVTCTSEREQVALLERLVGEGLSCRAMVS